MWRRVTSEIERLCALYGYRPVTTPVFEDTALFERTSGAGSDVVHEGDVHVRRSVGPFADASAGGDGADLPRLRRARPAPRATAGEALHDRVDVPLQRAGQGPAPGTLAGVGRGDRERRSVRRRGAHPALRHDPRPARRDPVPARAQLDRVPRVPARVPGHAERVARGQCRPARRGDAREGRDEPAARLRQLRARSPMPSELRSTRRRRSASRCVPNASIASRWSAATSTPQACATGSSRPSFGDSTTTRAPPGSSSARWRTRTQPSRAAAATTTSWRRSAGRPRRESASARASSA